MLIASIDVKQTTAEKTAFALSLLPQTADVVLVAKISAYTRDPADKIDFGKLNTVVIRGKSVPFFTGMKAIEAITTIKLRGSYTFKTIHKIKGDAPDILQLDLPRISWLKYGGAQALRINEGDNVLLNLNRGADGKFTWVNQDAPFIKVGSKDLILKKVEVNSPQQQVLDFIEQSFTDPVLRQANTYLLRSTQDTSLVSRLAPYLNDPNQRVRDNVLYCMAVNQQVAAIPRIAQLAREMALEGPQSGGAQAVTALEEYKAPAAVPYLNPMLFEANQYVRLNSVTALGNLADKSSIPYFLLALYDPEWQNAVAPSAAAMLHKLIPALGDYPTREVFLKQRKEWTARYWAWWRDELSGKHLPATKAGQSSTTRPRLPDLTKLKPEQALPLIYPLLFEPPLQTRQEAMAALEKIADRSSIPYLLIAVQDPDTDIAYAAYKKFFRLVDGLGLGQIRQNFVADREAATKPLYDWWKDELLEKHLPKPKSVATTTKPQ